MRKGLHKRVHVCLVHEEVAATDEELGLLRGRHLAAGGKLNTGSPGRLCRQSLGRAVGERLPMSVEAKEAWGLLLLLREGQGLRGMLDCGKRTPPWG